MPDYRKAGIAGVAGLGAGAGVLGARLVAAAIGGGPTADFTWSPLEPVTHESVAFDATASVDPDPDRSITAYDWDIDGTAATGPTPSHTFTDTGLSAVTLTVTNDAGETNSVTKTVPVGNTPPVAEFSFTPSSPVAGDEVTFDAAASSDPNGSIASFEWSIEGQTLTGEVVTHTFTASGNFDVTLTVTDDNGATASTTQTVSVGEANDAPTADFTFSPTSPVSGETVTFDGSGSSDPDGSIASWAWDFGDGTVGTGELVDHAYADSGDYTVQLTVTDDDGATATTSQTVTVQNAAPTADFTWSPTTPTVDEQVQFDGTTSSDVDGSIASYAWDFGDGATATGSTPTHTYTAAGDYTVQLTVTDDDGATDTATDTITVLSDTQFFTDFSEYATGTGLPADWTDQQLFTGNAAYAIVADTAFTGGQYLEVNGGDDVQDVATWDLPGEAQDEEVVSLVQNTSGFDRQNQIIVRFYLDANGDHNGYFVELSDNGQVTLKKWAPADSGEATLLDTVDFAWTTDVRYWMRLRAEGTLIQGKVWEIGTTEPDTWMLSAEDTQHTSGLVGVGRRRAHNERQFDTFGVGLAGAQAPMQ